MCWPASPSCRTPACTSCCPGTGKPPGTSPWPHRTALTSRSVFDPAGPAGSASRPGVLVGCLPSAERVRCILPRVHGHRPGTVQGAEPTAGSSLDFGNYVTDRKTLTRPRLRQAPSCHGRMGPSIRNTSAEQLLFHPMGWLSTATTMTVWIGNSHRHYRPGLPSVARCFLSRVLLASSIASTDWMYSAIYSGGRPCSLPPARTKSLYQL